MFFQDYTPRGAAGHPAIHGQKKRIYHKYFEQVIDGKLWLNPGSCGKRRFGQKSSFAVLTIDMESYQVQKIVFPQA